MGARIRSMIRSMSGSLSGRQELKKLGGQLTLEAFRSEKADLCSNRLTLHKELPHTRSSPGLYSSFAYPRLCFALAQTRGATGLVDALLKNRLGYHRLISVANFFTK